ncbi:MAG TPA: glycosyltransferase [Longimicrobiales bacterium]|nr:glycosyltransferase [Longimicrobiales bacterium]
MSDREVGTPGFVAGGGDAVEPRVSVVIPVRNGAATLPTQLAALARQQDAPPFEVIISDNGSTDGTRSVAEGFADRLAIRIVDSSDRRGPAHARNVGAAAARAPHLLFCDADDRVSDAWVGAMHRALEKHRIVTGPTYYVDASRLEDAERYRPRTEQTAPRLYLDRIPFSASNNLGIRAELFRELGGFDPGLQCGEDADLSIRAQLAGAELAWAPDGVVYHARRESLAGAARQFFRYGFYNAKVYRKLRGTGLFRRPAWTVLRPYLVLVVTPYRLFTRSRWSWIINASQRAGRIVGSFRFRVFCP